VPHFFCIAFGFHYLCNMVFNDLIAKRRSHRSYAGGELDAEQVQAILRAALMSPTSRNNRLWQFVVVDDRIDLQKLSDAKEQGASFVKDAALAVAVLGCPAQNDCWVEDGSIAAFAMQLQAEDLGLASCWVQIRGRRLSDGTKSSDVVRGILDIPEDHEVLCLIAFGKKNKDLPPHDDDSLKWENIHPDKF
jgi:nitroreductase